MSPYLSRVTSVLTLLRAAAIEIEQLRLLSQESWDRVRREGVAESCDDIETSMIVARNAGRDVRGVIRELEDVQDRL